MRLYKKIIHIYSQLHRIIEIIAIGFYNGSPLKETGLLRLTVSISRNFFLYFLIRDFLRKRTSKEQYPSNRAPLCPSGIWSFMKGVHGENKLNQFDAKSGKLFYISFIRDFL